jgi:hypothetical protein
LSFTFKQLDAKITKSTNYFIGNGLLALAKLNSSLNKLNSKNAGTAHI